jgi:hypothetical protein
MNAEDRGQSGYYQTIARAFLERRGASFFLSPRDQSVVAGWEEKRIPLRVVLEGIDRTFDGLVARGRGTKGVSLSFCERQVEAAFAQHRDRSAGRRKAAAAEPSSNKKDKARREIERAVDALASADPEISRLLRTALAALDAAKPDEAALERIDAEVEEILWAGATAADRATAEADVRRELRGRRSEGLAEMVRRKVVKASRAGRRIPPVSLFYY